MGQAAISTLGYAIMALLAHHPSTGYELSSRFRRPLGYFWTAQHSQIHPELRRLLAAGLVDFESSPGPGPHAKKTYSVTDSGQLALRGWLTRPPRPEPVRSELLLKTYAIPNADPQAAAAMFADRLAEYQRELEEYVEIRATIEARHDGRCPPSNHPEFGNYGHTPVWNPDRSAQHRLVYLGDQAADELATRPPRYVECMYDDGMGFPNLQRELTRARNAYLGAVRRLDLAMEEFSTADVPLMPAENGAIAPWTAGHGATMSACAEAWSAVVAARRGCRRRGTGPRRQRSVTGVP